MLEVPLLLGAQCRPVSALPLDAIGGSVLGYPDQHDHDVRRPGHVAQQFRGDAIMVQHDITFGAEAADQGSGSRQRGPFQRVNAYAVAGGASPNVGGFSRRHGGPARIVLGPHVDEATQVLEHFPSQRSEPA